MSTQTTINRRDILNGGVVNTIRNSQSAFRNTDGLLDQAAVDELYTELNAPIEFHFAIERRQFVQILGAGVLVSVVGVPALAQQPRGRGRGRGGFGAVPLRYHLTRSASWSPDRGN